MANKYDKILGAYREDDSGAGGGQTLYTTIVDAAGGGDYTTLGAAITAASAGDTIFVRSGTYTESALSETKNDITIIGENWKDVIIDLSSNSWLLQGFGISFRDIRVNITTGQFRILSNAGSHSVEHCYFFQTGSHNGQFLNLGAAGGGMYNCEVYSDNTNTGNSYTVIISGKASTDTGGYAVLGCKFSTNATHTNTVLGTINFAFGTVVAGCTFRYLGTGAQRWVGANENSARFFNNIFVGTGSPSGFVALEPRFGGVIEGNYFRTCDTAIRLVSSTGGAVVGNNIESASDQGIKIAGSNFTITGNSLRSNLVGTGILVEAGADKNIVNGNIVKEYATGVNISAASCDKNIVTSNQLDTNTTPFTDSGTGTVSANNVV